MYPYINIGNLIIETWYIFFIGGFIITVIAIIFTRPHDFSLGRGKIALSAITYMVAGMAGAVILHLIIYRQRYEGFFAQHTIGRIGIASLGVPLFGFLALWILSKEARFSFIDIADFGTPYVMLTSAFVRIGCLLSGCCYGIPTTLPWGFQFLSDGVTRHPTQAYAMVSAFAVFGSSRFIYKKLRQFKGLTFFYAIFMYSFLRFFNEFLRQEGPCIVGQLKISHPFLLLFMLIGIFGMYKAIKKPLGLKQRIEIKKAFSGALLWLFIWLFCSAIFPLTIIYIVTRIWQ